jgi:cell division septum initiation protein DivIVA
VDLDRQSIEKRDFPIGRRGYDPEAVDAHLRALASEIEELQRTAAGRGSDSLAASAGTQVQAIVAAAEVAAAEIESDARASAESTRAQAQSDAEKTRADAIARAQAHVAAVGRATATLLERVQALDGETGALVDSLRAGATRLAGDLASVETNMGELYDAASGRAAGAGTVSAVSSEQAARKIQEPLRPQDVPSPPVAASPPPPPPPPPPRSPAPSSSAPTRASTPPGPVLPTPEEAQPAQPAGENGDLDGARLIALNMALNGDSREQTDKYLAENYEVADRAKLLDEVYAAIEG